MCLAPIRITKQYEKKIAELLEREIGGELYMVPRVNNPEGVRTPDFLFNCKMYDLKTPKKGAGENTLFRRVRKASNQAKGIIVDISVSGLDKEAISRQIDKVFFSKDTLFIDELVILKDNAIISVS